MKEITLILNENDARLVLFSLADSVSSQTKMEDEYYKRCGKICREIIEQL